jgi:hypothetical protein
MTPKRNYDDGRPITLPGEQWKAPDNSAEKLRVIDIIKENAGMVISIGGFVWLIFQFLIIPVMKLEYDVGDILNNHLKTIQDQMTIATTERDAQGKQLTALSEQMVRLSTLLETKTTTR